MTSNTDTDKVLCGICGKTNTIPSENFRNKEKTKYACDRCGFKFTDEDILNNKLSSPGR